MISKIHHQTPRAFHFIRNVNWLLIAILLVMGTFGKRGWLDLKRMRNENRRLQEELMKVREQKQALSGEIRALENDKQTQEHTIRKVLGYIRADETVIEF